MIFYNEIEPFAARWMRAAMEKDLIARGFVVEDDVRNFLPFGATQYHAFAGIGIWSHALRLAGWPDDLPVWTGSCPCQPFSTAGRKKGFDDARHLWPVWFKQIERCRPPIIFGEQVASPDGLKWLDSVFADLEGAGYSCEAFDLCAAGFGAPHIRQRLYFVAFADAQRCRELGVQLRSRQPRQTLPQARRGSEALQLGDARGEGSGRDPGAVPRAQEEGDRIWLEAGSVAHLPQLAGATRGFWNGADFVGCRDGKWRPIEPGTFPLAHGARSRVGRLRAHGNQIVPQVAAGFISAVMEWLVELAGEKNEAAE